MRYIVPFTGLRSCVKSYAKIGKLRKKDDRRRSDRNRINVMEQISITSSGGNTSDTPSSAGSSFTPPTPVQSSDINCIEKRLQAVFESESQDEKHDEPDQMYLSGSSGSEEKLLEVKSFGLEQDDLCDPNTRLNSTFLKAANDTDTEQNIEDDHNITRQLEALIQASGYILRPSNEAAAALPQMRTEPKNENKALVKVCHDGDINVHKLLGEDQSVHETSEEGESLLSIACSAGFYELAQFLLAMQANVENRGIKGHCTPLMEAASSGFVEIVKLLIQHGAVVNALSSTGNTPLMYACTGGHVETVKLLLENGANVDDHNENGHTPLMKAASAGHVMVAKILLNHGASINSQLNEFKESALTLACHKGHLEMVRFLLAAGADQDNKLDEMYIALMEASMYGHVEVARLLLDFGAQVNILTESFELPLDLAAGSGHVELALLLIERGANIEEINDEGYTPLMEAARAGHENMVSVLLNKGANVNAQTEETQETALTLACCGGFINVADFLINNGAILELGASTPLMEAAQEGYLELVRYLLKCGADVNAQTTSADTALTYACENGQTDVADMLLQFCANLEQESEGGFTPLMKSCSAGHLSTVQFLISKNADINRVTANNDHTPLSLACAGGHLAVVELLLTNSADPYHKLKDNSTMVIEAAKGGHTDVVKLLLDLPHSVPITSTPPTISPVTDSQEVLVIDESELSEVHFMSKAHAIPGRIVESYGPYAKHNDNSCILKALVPKTQHNTPDNPSSYIQSIEQELKENGSLSMVTLMTTPPLIASSTGVLDSSTSSTGSNSDAGLLDILVSETLTNENLSNSPNIEEGLPREIQKHLCNINNCSESGISSTFSSQSFKNYFQNQTSIDFGIKNLSPMDIAKFAEAVSQLTLVQQTTTTETISSTLNNCMPTQVVAATQTSSESVTSNKDSATTTTTAMTTTTNKGFSTTTGESCNSDADISYGINVDSQTESSYDTALTFACAGGHEELIKLLLVRGANIEHRNKKGFTPLIIAATGGFDKIVEILLNNGANMEAQSERTKDTALSLACSGGRYEVCELFLQRGANKEHRNVSDYTPLCLAASGGYVNIINLLLNNGAEINSRTGSKLGISPLMLGAMNGHMAAVKLLLARV